MLTMTPEQFEAQITLMQERRMRSHTMWTEAQALKDQLKSEKDKVQLEKRLVQMEKLFTSVDAGLTKLRNYAAEIAVLRLTAGVD